MTIELNGRKYVQDVVTARALRELKKPMEILRRGDEDKDAPMEAAELDVLVRWLCLLFNNQFTPEDVYDHYPADRLLLDVSACALMVQLRMTEALRDFPTRAGRNPLEIAAKKKAETEAET